MPFFSVIIPVYNAEKYLNECIDSVRKQSFTDWEMILVDDVSPDRCPDICDEYAAKDARIKTIHLTENIRPGGVRNIGVKNASGTYLLFIDSDDWIVDGSLQRIYDTLQKAPDTEVVILWWKYFYENRNPQYSRSLEIDPADYSGLQSVKFVEKMFSSGHYTPHVGAKAIRRDFFLSQKLFIPENCFCEDPDWAFDLFRVTQTFAVCDGDHYVYRQSGNSVTRSKKFALDIVKDRWRFIKKWSDICENKRHPTDILYLHDLAYHYGVFLGNLGNTSKEQRKTLWPEVKEYKWLLSYAKDRKTKLAAAAVKLLGLRLGAKLLGLFIRLKQVGL